jgi:hypothetical protein
VLFSNPVPFETECTLGWRHREFPTSQLAGRQEFCQLLVAIVSEKISADADPFIWHFCTMYKVSSKRSATSTPCHVLQPYFVNLALTLCSKAELKSQNPKRLRREARRDQAYHSAWLSSETMARWQQGDLCVIHASGHTQISGHYNCSLSQGFSAIFLSW